MKNLSMSISSFNSPVPAFPPSAPPQEVPKTTNVTFSVQFDNEMEALEFTKIIIDNIQNYNAGGV